MWHHGSACCHAISDIFWDQICQSIAYCRSHFCLFQARAASNKKLCKASTAGPIIAAAGSQNRGLQVYDWSPWARTCLSQRLQTQSAHSISSSCRCTGCSLTCWHTHLRSFMILHTYSSIASTIYKCAHAHMLAARADLEAASKGKWISWIKPWGRLMPAYPLSPLVYGHTEKHMEAQLRPTQRARTVKAIKKSATFLKGVRLGECAINAFWQS